MTKTKKLLCFVLALVMVAGALPLALMFETEAANRSTPTVDLGYGSFDDIKEPDEPKEPEEPKDPEEPGEPKDPEEPGDPDDPDDPDNPDDFGDPEDADGPEEEIAAQIMPLSGFEYDMTPAEVTSFLASPTTHGRLRIAGGPSLAATPNGNGISVSGRTADHFGVDVIVDDLNPVPHTIFVDFTSASPAQFAIDGGGGSFPWFVNSSTNARSATLIHEFNPSAATASGGWQRLRLRDRGTVSFNITRIRIIEGVETGLGVLGPKPNFEDILDVQIVAQVDYLGEGEFETARPFLNSLQGGNSATRLQRSGTEAVNGPPFFEVEEKALKISGRTQNFHGVDVLTHTLPPNKSYVMQVGFKAESVLPFEISRAQGGGWGAFRSGSGRAVWLQHLFTLDENGMITGLGDNPPAENRLRLRTDSTATFYVEHIYIYEVISMGELATETPPVNAEDRGGELRLGGTGGVPSATEITNYFTGISTSVSPFWNGDANGLEVRPTTSGGGVNFNLSSITEEGDYLLRVGFKTTGEHRTGFLIEEPADSSPRQFDETSGTLEFAAWLNWEFTITEDNRLVPTNDPDNPVIVGNAPGKQVRLRNSTTGVFWIEQVVIYKLGEYKPPTVNYRMTRNEIDTLVRNGRSNGGILQLAGAPTLSNDNDRLRVSGRGLDWHCVDIVTNTYWRAGVEYTVEVKMRALNNRIDTELRLGYSASPWVIQGVAGASASMRAVPPGSSLILTADLVLSSEARAGRNLRIQTSRYPTQCTVPFLIESITVSSYDDPREWKDVPYITEPGVVVYRMDVAEIESMIESGWMSASGVLEKVGGATLTREGSSAVLTTRREDWHAIDLRPDADIWEEGVEYIVGVEFATVDSKKTAPFVLSQGSSPWGTMAGNVGSEAALSHELVMSKWVAERQKLRIHSRCTSDIMIKSITVIGPSNDVPIPFSWVNEDTIQLEISNSLIQQLINRAEDGVARVNLTSAFGVKHVLFPPTLLSQIAAAGLSVQIMLPQGTILFNAPAAASIASQAGGRNILLTMYNPAPDDEVINDAQKSSIGNRDMVYKIALSAGNAPITDFEGTLTISVPWNAPSPAIIYHLDAGGGLSQMQSTFNRANRSATFITNHLSVFLVRGDPTGVATARTGVVAFIGIAAVALAVSGGGVVIITRKLRK
jgi:hypothetical protein